MALDKLVDSQALDNALDYTASRIRSKTGGSSLIPFDLEHGSGFGDAVDAIETGGGTFENISIQVKNSRASGNIAFGFPNVNATVGAVCVNTVTVAVGNSVTLNVLDQNGVIGFNVNQALTQVTYDGTELPFAITGSSNSRKIRVTLPSSYDNTVPIEFV